MTPSGPSQPAKSYLYTERNMKKDKKSCIRIDTTSVNNSFCEMDITQKWDGS